ncbi:MFS transporter [Pseudofrankia inefficax]|uniref:Major facilitator superfamily MFS_1 n=1 Tax=Pseudofrankia inefficax (strain DSM 45817 / CECT 9037 / DDB 130130 / EuI1c) TaxID=298654 RepID=E3J8R8_PSEI1|nr:MFS transporter [Pseudofrankia inefficax]ADP79651.1 major facilitator superfamily MFS_1 [Pseudofrankia inefficax]
MTTSMTAIPLGHARRTETAAITTPRAGQLAANDTRRLALLGSIVVSFLAASAAPTPLYQHYNAVWHGTALTTTTAFAIYAGAVLVGLLTLGEVSNHVGRRPVLLGSLGAQAVAVGLFATAGSFTPLFVGRVIQGIAAGAALGTLGAGMIDAHRTRGTILSAATPGVGTGLGALLAGLLVSYLPWPTHLVYLALIVVFAAQAYGVARLPETGTRSAGLLAAFRPRISVPAPARTTFLAVSPVLFAVWALPGFYGSLGPALTRQLAHSQSAALGGLPLFILAGVASVSILVLRDRGAAQMMAIGVAALVAGVVATAAAISTGSVAGYLVATAVAGIGFGSGLQGGIRTVVPLASPDQRPGLLSAVYLVSYTGMGLPAVIAGLLVSRGLDLRHVAIGYALALLLLALAAGVSLALPRLRRR